MWYSELYRRHLLDMHIEDWDQEFLSEFSPETYVENLKRAKINYAMIYLQSHVGLCYFPTKTGSIHRALEGRSDLIRRVVDLCHQNGIKVCGYYSLIYNTREHDKHPDWQMKCRNGISRREGKEDGTALAFTNAKGRRYGFCCPTNPNYRQFVYDQIDEMLEYFDVDALFFDMPFWPHTCYCKHCLSAAGGVLPEGVRQRIDFKARLMGEFIRSVTAHVKKRRPDMPVEHNFAHAVASDSRAGCLEEVMSACDYVGGDLYGDLYNHSFACKFYKNATKNAPFEQMFSRCKPGLRIHTLTKSPDEMKTALASTMSHHGATLVIDAIDPVGTMDERVYRQVGKVFDFQKPYEPFFVGDMVEEIGIYYGMRSRFNELKDHSRCACCSVTKTLARAHIPFGVTGSFHELDSYKIIAAPMLFETEDGDNHRLIEYVRNGGTLYLSGGRNKALVEALTGNSFIEDCDQAVAYIAPAEGLEEVLGGFNAKYPLPIRGPIPLVKAAEAEVIATLAFPYTKTEEESFASIHSDPPGILTDYPAITVNRFGKGRVIWSAYPIENEPYEEYRRIFLNLLHIDGAPDYFFYSDAPKNVELTAFKSDQGITVNAVVLDEETESTPIAPFTLKVKANAASVRLLPSGEELPFTHEGEYVLFKTRTTKIFDMYEIKEK